MSPLLQCRPVWKPQSLHLKRAGSSSNIHKKTSYHQSGQESDRLRGGHRATGCTGVGGQEREVESREKSSWGELSPHSDGSIATAVGVVDDGIEGLI